MGNALTHHGDGLTVAEMSGMESYYSMGMTSEMESMRTETDDNTTSVITRQRMDAGLRNGNVRGSRTQDGTGSSTGRSSCLRPVHRHSSPRRTFEDTTNYEETESRTDTSSAYHHGYRTRNELRHDKREDIEHRDEEGHGFERAYSRNRSPKSNGTSIYNVHSSNGKNKMNAKHGSFFPESEVDGFSNIGEVADIQPAETDMAFNGSEDEDEAQMRAILEKEIQNNRYRSGGNSEAMPPSESINHRQRAKLLLKQSREESLMRHKTADRLLNGATENDDTQQNDSFSTLTKTLSELHSMFPEQLAEGRRGHRKVPRKPVAAVPSATPSSKHHSSKKSREESSVNDFTAENKLEELLKQQQLQEERLQMQLEQLRIQKERLQQLQEDKRRSGGVRSEIPRQTKEPPQTKEPEREVRAKASNDSQAKSSKDIPTTPSREVQAKPSKDTSSKRDLSRKERLERAKQEPIHHHQVVMSKPSRDTSSKQELSRRARLERARAKVMPSLPKVATAKALNSRKQSRASLPPRGPAELQHNAGVEESSGTVTGEVECSSHPEHEDMPSRISVAEEAHQDMTTISPSLTEYADDDDSTLSSMGGGEDGEKENALGEVMSSIDEEIDLVFVAKYDRAFSAFLEEHPDIFGDNTDLIQNLKVAKLQRILEVSYQAECDLEAQLEARKSNLEAAFREKLKEASRQKAERTIQLQNELNHLKKVGKVSEAKLTWDVVHLSVNRALKLKELKQELDSKDLSTPHDMLAFLPDNDLMAGVIQAVEAKPRKEFGKQEKKELQQCQVDNALLKAEVKVLEQKIAALKNAKIHQDQLDSLLSRLDDKKLKKLKTRYQKKLGFAF